MTWVKMTKEEFVARWKKDQKERRINAKRKAEAEYRSYVRSRIARRRFWDQEDQP